MTSREVRLLLVDDDPSAIQIMSRMLAQYPEQQFATSGQVALRLARQSPPDLIVLDIEMPGMSGFDVCEELQADPVLAEVPVIFATGHVSAEMEAVALRSGAVDFVSKPLIPSQLTARVRARLRTKRLLDDLARERAAVGAALGQRAPQTPRLLIVDDDVAAIRILQTTLLDIGEVHFARSGEEALRLARSLCPQVILLDAHMPDLDGFEVCTSLKAEPGLAHIPVVFVTRFSDPRNEMRALDLGAADFIAKPYTPAVLLARVRNLLEQTRRTEAELHSVREHWRRIGDARVATIVESASDAILSYDARGHIMLANAAACWMVGLQARQLIGQPVETLFGEMPDAAQPGDVPVRLTVKRADGRVLPAEASFSCVGEGEYLLTTAVLRDVSDRDRLEAESRARAEAEAASRTKTLMLSYIAHEMGNPLNGLLGFAQLMELDNAAPLPAPQAERLGHILASGRRLEALLRDVLDLGRFQTGQLTFELVPVDAARAATQAASALAGLARMAGVVVSSLALSTSAPVLAVADAGRLHQCLLNLLTNAVKYNRPGGWVRIDASASEGADSSEIAITVRDNGMGMEPSQLDHLFEPFNRLGRERASVPGAGLGLVITRLLVEAMNGRLFVESQPGAGSCFTIVLPAAALSAHDSPTRPPAPP